MREVLDAVIRAMNPIPDALVATMSHPMDYGLTTAHVIEYCKTAPHELVRRLLEKNHSWFGEVKAAALIAAVECIRDSVSEASDKAAVEPLTEPIGPSPLLFSVFVQACEDLFVRNLRYATAPSSDLNNAPPLQTSVTGEPPAPEAPDLPSTATEASEAQIEPLSATANISRPIGNSYVAELPFVVGANVWTQRSSETTAQQLPVQRPASLLLRWFQRQDRHDLETKLKGLAKVLNAVKIHSAQEAFSVAFLLSAPRAQTVLVETAMESLASLQGPLPRQPVIKRSSNFCIALVAFGLAAPYLAALAFPLAPEDAILSGHQPPQPTPRAKPVTLRALLERVLAVEGAATTRQTAPPISIKCGGDVSNLCLLPEALSFAPALAQLAELPCSSTPETRVLYGKLHSLLKATHRRYVWAVESAEPGGEGLGAMQRSDVSFNLCRAFISGVLGWAVRGRRTLLVQYVLLELNSARYQHGQDSCFDVASRLTVRIAGHAEPSFGLQELKLARSAMDSARRLHQPTEGHLGFDWFRAATDVSLAGKRLALLEQVISNRNPSRKRLQS